MRAAPETNSEKNFPSILLLDFKIHAACAKVANARKMRPRDLDTLVRHPFDMCEDALRKKRARLGCIAAFEKASLPRDTPDKVDAFKKRSVFTIEYGFDLRREWVNRVFQTAPTRRHGPEGGSGHQPGLRNLLDPPMRVETRDVAGEGQAQIGPQSALMRPGPFAIELPGLEALRTCDSGQGFHRIVAAGRPGGDNAGLPCAFPSCSAPFARPWVDRAEARRQCPRQRHFQAAQQGAHVIGCGRV